MKILIGVLIGLTALTLGLAAAFLSPEPAIALSENMVITDEISWIKNGNT